MAFEGSQGWTIMYETDWIRLLGNVWGEDASGQGVRKVDAC